MTSTGGPGGRRRRHRQSRQAAIAAKPTTTLTLTIVGIASAIQIQPGIASPLSLFAAVRQHTGPRVSASECGLSVIPVLEIWSNMLNSRVVAAGPQEAGKGGPNSRQAKGPRLALPPRGGGDSRPRAYFAFRRSFLLFLRFRPLSIRPGRPKKARSGFRKPAGRPCHACYRPVPPDLQGDYCPACLASGAAAWHRSKRDLIGSG